MPRFLKLCVFFLLPVAMGLTLACSGGGGGSTQQSPTAAITSFSPTSAQVGDSVVIVGTGLSGSTAVAFGGVGATAFSVDNDARITATVPIGAVSGRITVNAGSGFLTSSGTFTVLPPLTPAISSFAPTSAHEGDSVVISGLGFTGSTAVAFGGVPAVAFHVDSNTQITATVPSGAKTGLITVTALSGLLTSSSSFTVLPMAPVISGFTANPSVPGTTLAINGQHFMGATSVTIGGVSISFTVLSDTQIRITVPYSTWIGSNTIVVVGPGGSDTSDPGLSVVYPALAITGFAPTSGPAGMTSVTITGQGFSGVISVTFNGKQAASWSAPSSTQITATVPGGAATGLIQVTTSGATTTSTIPFLVAPVPTLDLTIDGAYITQSIQTYIPSVPLVQNRDGFLRVFPKANNLNSVAPEVRVRIFDVGTNSLLYTYMINAPTTSVPTSITEGTLTASWNKTITGSQIQTGCYLTLEVDPTNAVAETNKSNNLLRYPSSGNLDIRAVKVFKITIVPVTQNGQTGRVDVGRTLADWVDRFQRMYPVQNMSGVTVSKGAVFTTSEILAPDGTGWDALLPLIRQKQVADAGINPPGQYYFGAVQVGYSSGVAGLGYVGLPAAIGWDKDIHDANYSDGGLFPEVFAHEVGHNLNLAHAPCGGASGPDLLYPYAGGLIGAWGWDHAYTATAHPDNTTPLRNPSTYKDIMSYCTPLWISDYNYKLVMNFRTTSSIGDVIEAPLVTEECLMVSGRIQNGQVVLEPAFKVSTIPQPPSPGAYTLQLQNAQGNLLKEIPFEPTEVADLPSGSAQHFVFAIPMDAKLEAALSGLRVLESGTVRASRAAAPVAADMVGVREPVSVRMRPGQAHLSWDPMAHPKVMVRDPRTGEVISFADGGSLDLETDATELEVTFSDGVRSTRRLLKVQ